MLTPFVQTPPPPSINTPTSDPRGRLEKSGPSRGMLGKSVPDVLLKPVDQQIKKQACPPPPPIDPPLISRSLIHTETHVSIPIMHHCDCVAGVFVRPVRAKQRSVVVC